MALKLTLKPHERVIINGCVIRNADRRQVLMIENRADVLREHEVMLEAQATTPTTRCYFQIQNALIHPDLRAELVPVIQSALADLVLVFRPEITIHLFEAANQIALGNYYKSLRSMRPVIAHEDTVFAHIMAKMEQGEAAGESAETEHSEG